MYNDERDLSATGRYKRAVQDKINGLKLREKFKRTFTGTYWGKAVFPKPKGDEDDKD